MKKIFASMLALAIVAAPQFSGLIPETIKPYFYAGAGLYEVLVRWIPTVKNASLVSQLMYLVKLIAPNNAAQGGTHD